MLFPARLKPGFILLAALLVTYSVANQALANTDGEACRVVFGGDKSAIPPASSGETRVEPKKKPLFEVDPKTREFKGLTQEGIAALTRARDIVRSRSRLFENELRNMSTLHHAGMVARLSKGNMFLYGPPGGAKSKFVSWLMNGESEKPFKLQLHQMTTERAFVGGENFEAGKLGRFEINTEGSLGESRVGSVDEFDKGSPGALSSLLSLMNEREILAGNKVIKAKLETLFATSNANLPEIFQQFLENGQGSTAPALLNRFQFKAFIYNWLNPMDQAILDARGERKRYLKTLAEVDPSVLKDEVFLEPEPLNWEEMRQLAQVLIKPGDLFMGVYREFIDEMRMETNRAIRDSEERHRQNHQDEPFVYFPSADYTERLRQQIPEVMTMSAFVDFLRSPLANDAMLKSSTSKRIELDPLSLWRAYLVMTTVGPGEVKLKLNLDAEQSVDSAKAKTKKAGEADGGEQAGEAKQSEAIEVDFDWSVDASTARDKRESLLIKNLQEEQERFNRVFRKHITKVKEQLELGARNMSDGKENDGLEEKSFEVLLREAE